MAKLDNWLAFTDRVNPPRLIDVNTISDLFNTLGESNFREFHISFIKWAPTSPPLVRGYYDGSTNNWEELKNKSIQFSYRYIYKGILRSRFSPISKAAITSNLNSNWAAGLTSIRVYIPGFFLDEPGADVEYNYFGHDDPKFYHSASQIELAFRESELDPWKLWKRIDVVPGMELTHDFTNKFNARPIAPDDIYQPFDMVS